MRKIEKIQTLDQQTTKLKQENDELAALAAKLKEQVSKNKKYHANLGKCNNGFFFRIFYAFNKSLLLFNSPLYICKDNLSYFNLHHFFCQLLKEFSENMYNLEILTH